jgi:hypothetical protein
MKNNEYNAAEVVGIEPFGRGVSKQSCSISTTEISRFELLRRTPQYPHGLTRDRLGLALGMDV